MAELHFTQNLRRHTACPDCTLDATTVADLLNQYFSAYPTVRGYVLDDQGEVRKHIKVLVDGRNVHDRTALTDPLESDSQVYVFQALSGG